MDYGHGHSDKTVKPYDYSNNIYYGSCGWNEKDKYNLSLSLYAQYLKEINEIHNIDVMAGYEWQHFHIKTDWDYPQYYPSTHLTHPGELVNPDYYETKNSLYKSENYLVSWFGRVNYGLLNRYLFTFTLRNDGSSRFSKDNRWGLFPSAAFAWKINEEAFLKDNDIVSDAKLRLGWGITGQQEGIGDYMYIPNFTVNNGLLTVNPRTLKLIAISGISNLRTPRSSVTSVPTGSPCQPSFSTMSIGRTSPWEICPRNFCVRSLKPSPISSVFL